ncbi:hypothetical protein WH47_02917 [Habropoda laboriosa]|uniref:Uncharacterized protein n=1 Tax=Habropoda laboriosa TaxID=597456 RepID=A0A0L7RHX0_9HYME|nr:hypothetical protein WH47_02917 [Habropoda laboriosa]
MAHSGIQITQINLHHSKSASANLAKNMAAMHTGIALIQEPWLVNNAIRGLSGCGNISYTRSKEKPRTCILVKGLSAILLPQVSCGNVTVIRLKLNLNDGGTLEFLLGSVYMPYDSPDSLGSEMMVLNRGTEPTFMDSRRQEVIDITISSEGMAGLVRNWRISTEPSGSVHRLLPSAEHKHHLGTQPKTHGLRWLQSRSFCYCNQHPNQITYQGRPGNSSVLFEQHHHRRL